MLSEGGLATDPVCVEDNADNLTKHPSFGIAASTLPFLHVDFRWCDF